jgi:peptide/nickel transport system substrate-binding protein
MRRSEMTRDRRSTRALGAMLVPVVVAVIVVGSTASAQSPSADERVVFKVGVTTDMVSANPFKACCSGEYEMLLMNYNMLYGFSAEDLSPVPELANECTPSSDYMTWTCDIRDDVTWHDGEPLTSEDIAFTYRFILDNKLLLFTDYLPYNPTFETPDATTLIWRSEEPTFAPTIPPYIPILPEHVWGKFDGKGAKVIKGFENVPAIGSGPFQLTEWKPGQFWRMEAVPGHFFGKPTIDEVVYQVFQSGEAAVQSLKSGEIDYVYDLNPTLFNALEGEPNIERVARNPNYLTNLAFNFGTQDEFDPTVEPTSHPALRDLTLRTAIEHGINRQAIADVVWQGAAVPADTMVPPDKVFWHLDLPAEEEHQYDPALANQMLDEAGYADTDGDGIREDPKSGRPLTFDILTLTDAIGSVDTGKLMKAQMEEIGINFDLRPVDTNKAYEEWYAGTFDAYVWTWGGDADPDFILSIFTTQQCLGWSDGCYSNPQYDEMYKEQRQIFDRDERQAYVHDMLRFIYEEVPEVAIVYPQTLDAYRTDRFEGYTNSPRGGGPIFAWRVDSYINLKPVTAATSAPSDDGGIPSIVWIGLGVVAVAAAGFVLGRRRTSDEDRA